MVVVTHTTPPTPALVKREKRLDEIRTAHNGLEVDVVDVSLWMMSDTN